MQRPGVGFSQTYGLGFWWWRGFSSLFVQTISAPSTSLFGFSGGNVAPPHFILSCRVETQNHCAGTGANCSSFTDQPLGKQSSCRQKMHIDSKSKNPRAHKNKGQEAHTHKYVHTCLQCVWRQVCMYASHVHVTCGDKPKEYMLKLAKNEQQCVSLCPTFLASEHNLWNDLGWWDEHDVGLFWSLSFLLFLVLPALFSICLPPPTRTSVTHRPGRYKSYFVKWWVGHCQAN